MKQKAFKNATRFIQEGGAQAVKLEGGVTVAEKVKRIVEFGVGYHGQVQFINEILGSFTDFTPQHTKQYTKLSDIVPNAITEYHEVKKDEA